MNDLNSEDGFNDATILLNEIVDEAIKNFFKFNLKQKTFPEIIENIRKKLFQRGKELVFLIEDFYWMTGIQKDLLPIFVEGGQNIESSEKLCISDCGSNG